MDQRKKFISDWLRRDWSMTDLCAFYGVSRKTGYKWVERFEDGGRAALADQHRAAGSHPNATPDVLEEAIIAMRGKYPFWGPRKLKRRLEKLNPGTRWPASSTFGEILKRNGLAKPRVKRRRTPLYAGPLYDGLEPNDSWAMDFKGCFLTGDGQRVDPLTLSDGASRYLLKCQAVKSTDGESVKSQLTACFLEFGLPNAIRSDNGPPFATTGLWGLSRLSVWLLKLGITPERIRPGHPEENGVHERMHKTLKQHTAKPPRATLLEQQKAFDEFRREFNDERPHESLGMKTPSEVYVPSQRAFPRRIEEPEYPGAIVRRVASNGTISWHKQVVYLTNALIGELVGLVPEADGVFSVHFYRSKLGHFDQRDNRETTTLKPEKVLPMCPV